MDREELMKVIRQGPVRITMNNNQTFHVPDREFAIVDDIAAHVLYRETNGKMRTVILPLVTMAVVEQLETSS